MKPAVPREQWSRGMCSTKDFLLRISVRARNAPWLMTSIDPHPLSCYQAQGKNLSMVNDKQHLCHPHELNFTLEMPQLIPNPHTPPACRSGCSTSSRLGIRAEGAWFHRDSTEHGTPKPIRPDVRRTTPLGDDNEPTSPGPPTNLEETLAKVFKGQQVCFGQVTRSRTPRKKKPSRLFGSFQFPKNSSRFLGAPGSKAAWVRAWRPPFLPRPGPPPLGSLRPMQTKDTEDSCPSSNTLPWHLEGPL